MMTNEVQRLWWRAYMAALNGASSDGDTTEVKSAVAWAIACADMTVNHLTNKSKGYVYDPMNE